MPEPSGSPATLTRGRRCELLSVAERHALASLAQRCLAPTGPPELLVAPQVGVVMLTVREPVEEIRFHLAEVLVSRAEVTHRGERGWATVLGDDTEAALAAAVCDAEAASGGPLAGDVDALCHETALAMGRARADEWASLAPTIVRFEEMS